MAEAKVGEAAKHAAEEKAGPLTKLVLGQILPKHEELMLEKALGQLKSLGKPQWAHVFNNSPLRNSEMEGSVLPLFVIKAYERAIPLENTPLNVQEHIGKNKTAKDYFALYVRYEEKERMERLFKYDESNPELLYLGRELADFIKARMYLSGLEITKV